VFVVIELPSSDKFSGVLSAMALFAAVGSIIQADKSFKQTNETLKMTKRDQEIQRIETSLNKFYYPYREYLSDEYMAGGIVDTRQPEVWRRIEYHRYLAITDETKNQVELAKKETYSHIGTATIELAEHVKNDIEELEKRLTEIKKDN
jgi:hypothetical protein